MNRLAFLLTCFVIILAACSKDYDKIDKEKIEDYLKTNNLTAQVTPTGVHYIVEKEGKGELLKSTDEIAVKYKGYLLDDKSFDKSDSAIFYLTDVIAGWTEGLQNFREGSEGKIFIPSSLAYGKEGVSNGFTKVIPSNAVLAFDIKILKKSPVWERNRNEIRQYIKEKGLKADSTATGIYYVIENVGTGSNPSSTATVTVKYKGYTTNGKVFDENTTGATFGLANVITGWQQGIPLFKKGGKGKLLIPSRLAYYNSPPTSSIAPYDPLIFDVELINY